MTEKEIIIDAFKKSNFNPVFGVDGDNKKYVDIPLPNHWLCFEFDENDEIKNCFITDIDFE